MAKKVKQYENSCDLASNTTDESGETKVTETKTKEIEVTKTKVIKPIIGAKAFAEYVKGK